MAITGMKTTSHPDVDGCSQCPNGQENYESFDGYIQYDYRHTNGKLFSVVRKTLEQCREERDNWLEQFDESDDGLI